MDRFGKCGAEWERNIPPDHLVEPAIWMDYCIGGFAIMSMAFAIS